MPARQFPLTASMEMGCAPLEDHDISTLAVPLGANRSADERVEGADGTNQRIDRTKINQIMRLASLRKIARTVRFGKSIWAAAMVDPRAVRFLCVQG